MSELSLLQIYSVILIFISNFLCRKFSVSICKVCSLCLHHLGIPFFSALISRLQPQPNDPAPLQRRIPIYSKGSGPFAKAAVYFDSVSGEDEKKYLLSCSKVV